jgi:hypothetical protein
MSFTLPENLTAISDSELSELTTTVRAHAQELLAAEPAASMDDIATAQNAYTSVLEEKTRRQNDKAAREKLAADLDAFAETPETPETGETISESVPEALAASKGSKGFAFDKPAPTTNDKLVTLSAAADIDYFRVGQEFEDFSQAAGVVGRRVKEIGSAINKGQVNRAPDKGQYGFSIFPNQTAVRHRTLKFTRNYPDTLNIAGGGNEALGKVFYAAKETRLPGGSLVQSAKKSVADGKALTAAVGWCAPSEVIYELCELSSLDGILDLPEVQAARGGFQVPADGGPDFSAVYDGEGGILTEYDIENDAQKVCVEIPCPDFEDVRLDAVYACLTGSLLQRQGYPEIVEWWTRETMKAMAHRTNQAIIARIAAASGPATVIPPIPDSDDAASSLLSAVALAVEDIRYRNRISRQRTLEVVLPYWAITQIRAALARRRGVYALDVTDSDILEFFAVRGAVPRFVYDWQDALTGTPGGPGGPTSLTALPTTVQFLVYPAGTWTKIVQEVVLLDTIYDSTGLTSNQYTALFAEDGFNVIQTCPDSRLYTATVDPSGIVGCCDTLS